MFTMSRCQVKLVHYKTHKHLLPVNDSLYPNDLHLCRRAGLRITVLDNLCDPATFHAISHVRPTIH